MDIIKDKRVLNTAITSIGTRGKKMDADQHRTAVSCVYHMQQHGDTTLFTRLCTVMPKSSRVQALRVWAEAFAPITVNKKDFTVKLDKGWKEKPWNIDGAIESPFYEFTTEKSPEPTSIKALVGYLYKKATADDVTKVEPDAARLAAFLVEAAKAFDAKQLQLGYEKVVEGSVVSVQ